MAQPSLEKQFAVLLFSTLVSILGMVALGVSLPVPVPKKKESPYKVVGTYKGCDTIQYTTGKSVQYAYFLDCSRKNTGK